MGRITCIGTFDVLLCSIAPEMSSYCPHMVHMRHRRLQIWWYSVVVVVVVFFNVKAKAGFHLLGGGGVQGRIFPTPQVAILDLLF